eukprot:GILI01026987.1.p1 GENE.GILI01026987.1~~GILI01026987.1.p1  ORF type:complete len:304 (+),score=35.29 GILI01026987.1:32-913(+)
MRNQRITTSNVTDIAKRASSSRPTGNNIPLPPRSSLVSNDQPPLPQAPKAVPASKKAPGIPARSSSTPSHAPHSVHQSKMSTAKLDPNRFANPFDTNTKKCKSSFSSSYINRSIPCRLQTTASRYHLQWEKGADTGFSPDLLIVCADGLIETDHPYVVMAPMMFQELCLRSEKCLDLFSPQVVETVAGHIRTALMVSGSATASTAVKTASSSGGAGSGVGSTMFEGALKALAVFLECTGNLMLPYLAKYIIPVLARSFSDKGKKEAVAEVLRLVEQQCGPEATKIIKAKIPTW